MSDSSELDQTQETLNNLIQHNKTLDGPESKPDYSKPNALNKANYRAARSSAYSNQPHYVSVSGKINPQGRKTW